MFKITQNRKEIIIMKKILTAIAALTFAVSLTACSGDKGNEQTSGTAADTSAVTEQSFAEGSDIPDETDLDFDQLFPDDFDVTEASEETDTSADEASDNPLMPMINKVLEESQWPTLAQVTDEYILSEFFLLTNTDNYNELIVMQCPMSAKMSEIIIIKADDAQAARADLDARRQKAIDTDAWYPADQELAAESIVGENGDYVYFLIGDNAKAGEDSINAYIDAL